MLGTTLPKMLKAQIINIQFVDAQLQQLRNELAVSDTARIGYTNALKTELDKIEIASSFYEQRNSY